MGQDRAPFDKSGAPFAYLGMQPEVAGAETTNFPSTTSARIEEAPQVQSVRGRFASVACAELSANTARSVKRRHALMPSRWPLNRTEKGWQEITRTA
jgi:tartrate dehydratase beta subunit/fumarate hydratase class I family protein